VKTNKQLCTELEDMQQVIHARIDPQLAASLKNDEYNHVANYFTIASHSVYVALECFRAICRLEDTPIEACPSLAPVNAPSENSD
jgi:hypothetical protein